jgi:pilus assembly protein CpaE
MPSEYGGTKSGLAPGQLDQNAAARHDRPMLTGFVTDGRTEETLREGLSEATSETLDLRRGGIRAAITTMQKSATPRVLIVDVSGDDQPLNGLSELAHLVEPDVCLLVVGDIERADFYRELTRGMGAAEYLSKPLTRERVVRHFGSFVRGNALSAPAKLGGRMIAITGVRGGVGATMIAVNLAWHFGVTMRRHTLLLDPDTHLGASAFLLNMQPGPGLRMALEAPETIESLLAEGIAQPAAERLHILAGEERIATHPHHAPNAGLTLLTALRKRYDFIISDVPFGPFPLYRELLDLADQRILVMDPSLASVRDTVRLLGLPKGPSQDQRAVIVLNRAGMPGGMSRKQIEAALKMKVDIVIPDLPKQVAQAATLGEPVKASSTGFRNGINEIARQVASTRLLDTGSEEADPAAAQVKQGLFSFLRKSA